MLAEKFFNNLNGAHFLMIPFFTISKEEGKKYSGFFNPVKRK
jgi:hypothetical protein